MELQKSLVLKRILLYAFEAKTIQQLLEFKPPEGYHKNEDKPLEGDCNSNKEKFHVKGATGRHIE